VSCLKTVGTAITILALNAGIMSDANAITMRVRCETRGLTRSKISVDAASIRGVFYAVVSSGGKYYKSKAPKATNSANQVEFDFDSYPPDIRAGATAIPATFIKNRTVYAYIRQNSNNVLVGAVKAICTAR
jgi:hypothetical protein